MPDREKVIKGLECCCVYIEKCDECPYMAARDERLIWCHGREMEKDALALLKEQDAIEPKKQIEEAEWIVCGHCNGHIIHKWKFCPSCGRKVKWE